MTRVIDDDNGKGKGFPLAGLPLVALVSLAGVAVYLLILTGRTTTGREEDAFFAQEGIPVPGVDVRVREGAGSRSMEKLPKLCIIVPVGDWPMKAPRDMQVMKEIIRIYGTKSTLKFLISERSWDAAESEDDSISSRVVSVNTARSKEGTWELVWRGLHQVFSTHALSFEWFAIVQLNSLVVIPHLQAYLSYLDPSTAYYIGHVQGLEEWGREGVLYNNEHAIILSQSALRLLAIRISHIKDKTGLSTSGDFACIDISGYQYDKRLGGCLREVGIEPMDTRDSNGRQRFLVTRPRKREEFQKSSAYPMSFGSLHGVQDVQSLEYFTLKQPIQDSFHGVEMPTAKAFRIPSGSSDLQMDSDGNSPSAPNHHKIGAWIDSGASPPCLKKKSKECECNMDLPKRFTGVSHNGSPPCSQGSSLKHDSVCGIRCGKDKGSNQGLARCFNGWVVYPELNCVNSDEEMCIVPEEPPFTIFDPKPKSQLANRQSLTVTCADGYRLAGGRNIGYSKCYKGSIGVSHCGKCGEWTIEVKGSKYDLGGWDKIKFNGVSTDTFQVTGVAAGSEQDPNKNCGEFSLPEQLILQEKSSGKLVTGLSCSNNAIDIKKTTFKPTGVCS
ncbi:hypothetical protein AAMO2058_001427400 [Amorphochlora amoebiformis]